MSKSKTNQERGRKYGGSSSFVDMGPPSRAPRQDEERESSEAESQAVPDSVDDGPKQVGGNRGQV
jgi:hypothetical protein